jgi:hypothetical protein
MGRIRFKHVLTFFASMLFAFLVTWLVLMKAVASTPRGPGQDVPKGTLAGDGGRPSIPAAKQTVASKGSSSAELSRYFTLTGQARQAFEIEIASPGQIHASAEWSGTAVSLALILNGPGSSSAYARSDGKSPLKLSFEITPEFLTRGKTWRISVVNFDRNTDARGTIRITYPHPAASSAAPVDKPSAAATTAVEAAPRATRRASTRAGQVRPSARATEEAQKPKLRAVTWGQIGMRPAEPGEPYPLPSLNVIEQSVRSPRSFRVKDDLIKVNRRSPLSLQRFDIVDPASGSPIPPETEFTLPNGRRLTAQEYYDELNSLEEGFNQLGYTLNVKRDPAREFTIKELEYPRPAVEANIARGKAIAEAHRFQDKPLPPPIDSIRRRFQNSLLQEEAPRLKRVQQYRRQDFQTASRGPWADDQAADRFSRTEEGKKEYGHRDSFGIFLGYNLSVSADISQTEFSAETEAGGYIFNHSIDFIRVSARTAASSSGGRLTGRVTVYVLGVSTMLVDESAPVPNVPLDQLPSVPHLDLQRSYNAQKAVGFETTFPLGPVLLSARVGAAFSTGLTCGLFLSPLSIDGQIGPYLRAEAFAQAGLSIIIAEAGVRCVLTIFNDSLTATAGVKLDADGRGLYVKGALSCYDELRALEGKLQFYVCVYVPCFDLPPWCKKCWNWTIADWEGLRAKGYFFNYDFESPLAGGGQTQVTDKGGQRHEVTGGLEAEWLPLSGSAADTSVTAAPHEPGLAAFGGRLYKFWSEISSGWAFLSFADGVETGRRLVTKKRQDRETGRWEEYKVWESFAEIRWSAGAPFSELGSQVNGCEFGNRLYVFTVGPGFDEIRYKVLDRNGLWQPQQGPHRLATGPGLAPGIPGVTVLNDTLYLFYTRNRTVCFRRAGLPSGGETALAFTQEFQQPDRTRGHPSAVSFKGCVFAFYKGESSKDVNYLYWHPTHIWFNKIKVDGIFTESTPRAVVLGDQLHLFCPRGERPLGHMTSESLPPRDDRNLRPKLKWGKAEEIHGSETFEMNACSFQNSIVIFHRGTRDNRLYWRVMRYKT